jgi:hypothetical protein
MKNTSTFGCLVATGIGVGVLYLLIRLAAPPESPHQPLTPNPGSREVAYSTPMKRVEASSIGIDFLIPTNFFVVSDTGGHLYARPPRRKRGQRLDVPCIVLWSINPTQAMSKGTAPSTPIDWQLDDIQINSVSYSPPGGWVDSHATVASVARRPDILVSVARRYPETNCTAWLLHRVAHSVRPTPGVVEKTPPPSLLYGNRWTISL